MNEEKIKKVFSDEAFVKTLMELETPEEVRKALAKKDIDLSVDEIKTIAQLLQKKTEGALNDEELEAVAGGGISGAIFIIVLGIEAVAGAGTITHIVTRRRW